MISAEIHKTIKNIPISGKELVALMAGLPLGRDYQSPRNKLVALEQKGDIIRLKKGLYILNSSDFGYPPSAPICSNHIYGPSYLSRQWALSYYGIIPERTSVYTATTIKHSRSFSNALGTFTYTQVPRTYFSIGLTNLTMDGASFVVATPEKALVDLILFDSHVPNHSMNALTQYLSEDIRMDMDELKHFNIEILQECLTGGHKVSTIQTLIKIIQKL